MHVNQNRDEFEDEGVNLIKNKIEKMTNYNINLTNENLTNENDINERDNSRFNTN